MMRTMDQPKNQNSLDKATLRSNEFKIKTKHIWYIF